MPTDQPTIFRQPTLAVMGLLFAGAGASMFVHILLNPITINRVYADTLEAKAIPLAFTFFFSLVGITLMLFGLVQRSVATTTEFRHFNFLNLNVFSALWQDIDRYERVSAGFPARQMRWKVTSGVQSARLPYSPLELQRLMVERIRHEAWNAPARPSHITQMHTYEGAIEGTQDNYTIGFFSVWYSLMALFTTLVSLSVFAPNVMHSTSSHGLADGPIYLVYAVLILFMVFPFPFLRDAVRRKRSHLHMDQKGITGRLGGSIFAIQWSLVQFAEIQIQITPQNNSIQRQPDTYTFAVVAQDQTFSSQVSQFLGEQMIGFVMEYAPPGALIFPPIQ
jgi:hypothetical protein